MNIERLNDLIRVMESVRDAGRAFNIGAWAKLDYRPADEVTLCNTACCAAGWCGFDPKFVENGFEMRATMSFDNSELTKEINVSTKNGWMEMLEACRDPSYDSNVTIVPYYAGVSGFGATQRYFNLSDAQNSYLFDGNYYSDLGMYGGRCTPDDVIDHVQRVLDGRWIEDPIMRRNIRHEEGDDMIYLDASNNCE